MNNKVYIAFRFHVNFYHSYRGDTPDEFGFGKDIRIIKSILDDLDLLNQEGIHVKGTWDIENYYTLEQYIPKYCPDLIKRIQDRVEKGKDVVEPMSYNNGIVSLATQQEFDKNMAWTIKNNNKSGLLDIFKNFEGVVRPQECTYTPSHLKHYKKHGIHAISLYYSSHPFNAFSNYIPKLDFYQRYNPLILRSETCDESMTLIPAYNNGDVADWFLSLRVWVKNIRKEQSRQKEQRNVLLLIDMDADDEFWAGMNIPILSSIFPSFNGLHKMVHSIAQFPYVEFTTIGEYLKHNEPVGTVFIEHDLADGSYDGLSSWSEKWSNTHLWKQINRLREKAEFVERLYTNDSMPDDIKNALDICLKMRLLSHSSTHFGLSSPIMNSHRLKTAQNIIDKASEYADFAISHAKKEKALIQNAAYLNHSSSNILKKYEFKNQIIYTTTKGDNVLNLAKEKEDLNYTNVSETCIYNDFAKVEVLDNKEVALYINGEKLTLNKGPITSITYGKIKYSSGKFAYETKIIGFDIVALIISGKIVLPENKQLIWQHKYMIAGQKPYIYAEVTVTYPKTSHKEYSKKLSRKLGQTWDARYREVMPFELTPSVIGGDKNYLSIIKHNFFGDVSTYKLDQYKYTPNRSLTSFNNHITNGFVGLANKSKAIYLGQSNNYDNSFAFCPMRLHMDKTNKQIVDMNPFGTYYGKQKRYMTGKTGLGKVLSLGLSDHLDSYAPSYNDRSSHFILMIAFEKFPTLSSELKNDLLTFSQSGVVIT